MSVKYSYKGYQIKFTDFITLPSKNKELFIKVYSNRMYSVIRSIVDNSFDLYDKGSIDGNKPLVVIVKESKQVQSIPIIGAAKIGTSKRYYTTQSLAVTTEMSHLNLIPKKSLLNVNLKDLEFLMDNNNNISHDDYKEYLVSKIIKYTKSIDNEFKDILIKEINLIRKPLLIKKVF